MFENLTEREKKLLRITGLVVPIALVFVAFLWFMSKLESNDKELTGLRRQVTTEQDLFQEGQMAKRRLNYYKKLSLPSDPNYAQYEFRNWINNSLTESGMEVVSRSFKRAEPKKTKRGMRRAVGRTHEMQVTTIGTLDQFVEFLDGFYRFGTMKRISKLNMTPLTRGGTGKNKNVRSGKFQFGLTIQAISMNVATAEKEIGTIEIPIENTLAEYRERISNRNIFSPANNPPSLKASAGNFYEGEEISFKATGSDLDEHDTLRFELTSPEIEGAQLTSLENSRSATFKCPPLAIGKYTVGIRVVDSGNPPKDFAKEVTFNVKKKKNNYPTVAKRSFDVYVGETVEFEIEASDKDNDPVTIALSQFDDLPDLTLEFLEGENKAIVRHPPFEESDRKQFEVKLDDGKEPRMRNDAPVDNIVSLTINVKPPKFVTAEFTKITSINRVKGVDQAWINVRPVDEIHVVKAGDSFKIDRDEWFVKSVSVDEGIVVLQVDDKIKTYKFPSFLHQPISEETAE